MLLEVSDYTSELPGSTRREASVSCKSCFILVTALPGMWPCILSRNSVWPHGLYSPWNSLGQNTGVGSLSLLRGIFPNQGLNFTQVSCIAGRFSASWATGKPKNNGVGRLSLLQQIFPTQESNWGLLHCRWILYQLSHQRSPEITFRKDNFICFSTWWKH